MSEKHTISLPAAILITTNITLGSGLFVNTQILSALAGALSGVTYAIIGVLLLPLVMSIVMLLQRFPTGGFYTYGKHGIGSYVGFLSTWSYFIGKLASGTFGIHAAMLLLQTIIPTLDAVSTFVLDGIVITSYTLLNMLNVKEGSRIQALFFSLKMIPILFVIFGGLFLFQPSHLGPNHMLYNGLISGIPLGLYAFYGFESACAISKVIKNPERNAHRAVLFSYSIAVILTTLFQTFFYASLGTDLAQQVNFLGAFPAFVTSFISPTSPLAPKLIGLLHIAIACSALGSAYGVIYSNAWNLHTLALHKHIFFPKFFASFNRNRVPYIAIIAEACVIALYLIITQGSQMPLQLIGVISLTITYMLSVLSLLIISRRESTNKIIPFLALLICSVLLIMCLRLFFIYGIRPLILYLIGIAFGTFMYLATLEKRDLPDLKELSLDEAYPIEF